MGRIFNIQKFCLHDGPGIRTTVFFQGCPLRCAWCSNPESRDFGAGAAGVAANPETANPETTGSETAGSETTGAEGVAGVAGSYEISAARVREICLQDRAFYASDGGVTLSGGEPFGQPDFAEAIIDALREEGIGVAVETSGYVPDGSIFARIALKAGLLLFDIKHWDDRRHREGAGVGVRLIMRNLITALDLGVAVLPRIPVIPGFNDSLDDALELSRVILSLGLNRAQLLPFHQFGEGKYEKLALDYAYSGVAQLREEDLRAYRDVFIANGVAAYF